MIGRFMYLFLCSGGFDHPFAHYQYYIPSPLILLSSESMATNSPRFLIFCKVKGMILEKC